MRVEAGRMEADAIVIGAGAAGLAAARELAGRSLRVILLEARDRIGGRVWSVPLARGESPAELGAEFIHGAAPATIALMREAGLVASATAGESWTCDDNGELRHNDEDFSAAAGLFERVRTLAHDESVERFLQRLADESAAPKMLSAARAFVEGFDAADPAIASAQAIADEWNSGVDFASSRPVGGYRPIVEHLRTACDAAGVRTHLSSLVRRISWRRGAVTVDARDERGDVQTFHAPTAIVTLPVGVLHCVAGEPGAVVFDPVLPNAKRTALQSIRMGPARRVTLQFRTPFWERINDGRYRGGAFFRCAGRPFPTFWTQVAERNTSVVGWAGGPAANALDGMGEEELIALALEGFGTLLGAPAIAQREFEAGVTHDWSRDPFSRGAYSYIAVGGGNARALLAASVDETLFFAGEATSGDGEGGTVNGALETGARAAREAASALHEGRPA